MFRRSKSEAPLESAPLKEDGKGRPTPTRKEAEAAARARARAPRNRKEEAARQRMARGEQSKKIRAGMKAGDERYLLPRDKGPLRSFTRDFIDVRFSFLELMIPLMIFTLILGWSGNTRMMEISNTVLFGALLLIIVDSFILNRRLKKAVARRFPDESTKGLTFYAITRSMQMKFMRLPKAKVKIGQELPEHYR